MAELVGGAFLSSFLSVLFDRLASREVVDFFHGKKLIVDQLKDLEIMLLSANAVLNDAEEKQMEDPNVRKWLDELKEVVYQADELVDKINTEALRLKIEGESESYTSKLFTKLNPFSSKAFYDAVNSKIVEIIRRLKVLMGEKDVLGLKAGVQNKLLRRLPAALAQESGVYGRDVDKETIIKLLLADNISRNAITVIPIVGMGGIGKTTLAQLIFNDSRVREYFESEAWVTVSHESEAVSTMKKIYEGVTSQKCDIEDPYKLQIKLKEALEGKKFLVVLDDVWNENYGSWNLLKSSFDFGGAGSKIIVTTRSRIVASKMGNVPIHDLHVISDEDSWQLFSKHAFNSEDEADAYPALREIGREIVKKCKGLPLAIKSLAGLLRSVFDLEEWRRILKSDIWELHLRENGRNEILPALWLSYHYLPSPLKRCFAYCSVFPKGYNWEKRHLILLWIAEGLLQSKGGKRMEDIAEEYIRSLISRSLIQQSSWNESTLLMHDLFHDLANFVSGEFRSELDENGSNNLTIKTRHLACVGEFESMKCVDLSKAECLHTFLALQPSTLHGVLPQPNRLAVDELLASTGGCLKALSLPRSFLTELPNSIGSLKHIRYLDLSSTEIKELPHTVCSLYNLQTLLLAYCTNLTQLPTNLGNLINLRHLDISNTFSLKEMPPHICNLTELQTLTNFVVGRHGGSSIKELGKLQCLSGSIHISGLENVVNIGDVWEANLKEKKFDELTLRWDISGSGADDSQKERQVLDALQPPANLKQLSMYGYRGTRFANWVGHHSFSDTVEVRLHYCKSCFFLPPFGQLPSLKKLEIWGCDSVMTVSSEFYSDGSFMSKPFRSLEILHFWNMPEWKEWSFPEGEGVLPRLKELHLEDCPTLHVRLPDYLPSLMTLQVLNCKQLMPLLPRAQDMDTAFPCLQVMKISGCPEQKSFLKGGLPSSLCSLSISFCDELETLEDECFVILTTSLKEVEIYDCHKFPGLPIKTPSDLIPLARPHMKKEKIGESSELSRSSSDTGSGSVERNEHFEGESTEDNKVADNTATHAGREKDIQGIPWDKFGFTREEYRQRRIEKYKSYRNVRLSGEISRRDCKITEKGSTYHEFRRNVRLVKPSICHFQLRNLVWSTSKHDVYLNSRFSIIHWSSLTSRRSEVLNISRHVAPSQKHPGSLLEGFTTEAATLAVKDQLLVVGGFQGELICKRLDWPGVSYCSRTTYDDNAITNCIEIYESPSGAAHFLASSNDCGVREFNMQRFQLSKHFCFPWPVNHSSLSPDGKLLVIVGDNPNGLLVDSQTGKTVMEFQGHLDYSFASAWHPNGLTFATGNQDKTCRVWDARNLSKSVEVLSGNLAAIRSIRFTSDGCYMAMAEAADFVHIFDVTSGYEREQEIELCGEIAGISFSPDTETLFIGVSDRSDIIGETLFSGVSDWTYGSLLEYGRQMNFTRLRFSVSHISVPTNLEI